MRLRKAWQLIDDSDSSKTVTMDLETFNWAKKNLIWGQQGFKGFMIKRTFILR